MYWLVVFFSNLLALKVNHSRRWGSWSSPCLDQSLSTTWWWPCSGLAWWLVLPSSPSPSRWPRPAKWARHWPSLEPVCYGGSCKERLSRLAGPQVFHGFWLDCPATQLSHHRGSSPCPPPWRWPCEHTWDCWLPCLPHVQAASASILPSKIGVEPLQSSSLQQLWKLSAGQIQLLDILTGDFWVLVKHNSNMLEEVLSLLIVHHF